MTTDHEPRLWPSDAAIRTVGEGFLACTLPKAEWTHEAHISTTCWLILARPDIRPERDLPALIRRYNESVGGVNSEAEGYHETITQVFIRTLRRVLAEREGQGLAERVNTVLLAPEGRRDWPLRFYSRELLFSKEARLGWVEPDLAPPPVGQADPGPANRGPACPGKGDMNAGSIRDRTAAKGGKRVGRGSHQRRTAARSASRMGRLLPLLLLLSSCATVPLRPAPARLQPWTATLRDQQPEDAFVAVYKLGSQRLVFVAAKHANREDSLTFRLIRDAYAAYTFDIVIAEGFATSRGPNPPSLFQYASENGPRSDGFVEGGETVPTVLGARQEGAILWGGEPDDAFVKASLLLQRVSAEDVLGFYVLRNIPQWIGERRIDDAGDPRLEPLVATALARNREALQLPATLLPGFTDWIAWYENLNRKAIGAGFTTEEVGPLADGPFGTNRIAYAISRARDAYLHELIITHLNARKNVLVVFGASHLMIHRPALAAVLGRPCYVGADLARSILACR